MHAPSESLPCPHCDLVQTLPVDGRCRRCARSLLPPPAFDALDAIDAYTSASFTNDGLPTLPPPALPASGGVVQRPSDDVLVYEGELELDLPVARTTHLARLSNPAPPTALHATAGVKVITATVVNASPAAGRRTPVELPHTFAARAGRAFVDPETGVIRTWIVGVMVLVCVVATVVGRLVRMRAEIVQRAIEGAEVGGP